jgi:uncharacterized protein with ATP-grasp and redox domains
MIKNDHPSLPIPDPLRGSESGSFAHDTVVRRLPNIVRRTITENEFPGSVVQDLQKLIDEIPDQPVRPLEDPGAPDEEEWHYQIRPYLGLNWLDVPWFFAEFYLYRRVLEATRYFRSNESGYLKDPYLMQKQMGLESAKAALQALAAKVNHWVERQARTPEVLHDVLQIGLWGNRADMSLWPVSEGEETRLNHEGGDKEKIIIDDSHVVEEHLGSLDVGAARIDMLLDNAGFELVTDLCLVDYLLSSNLAQRIVLHPKAYPVFVSDAMTKDVEDALLFMERQSSPEVDVECKRLRALFEEGRLTFREDRFWTLPKPLWEMPEGLRSDLSVSDLVISKGDAHYRRLLGDRHWLPSTPFADIMSYFPSPILALRVGKSEVVCGLEPERIERLTEEDPAWRTNGQWGWIQFKG